jgi:hypothetical protein
VTAQAARQVPFPIRVERVPNTSFARLRGLPASATLSEGHSIAPGAWAIPRNALADLTITLPQNITGKTDVVVTIVGPDGAVLAEARATLVIAAPPASSQPPVSQPPISQPPMSPDDRKRAFQLVLRGNEQLAQGLVAPARQFFERAADMGLAEAAMALAATYDPVELAASSLAGVQPDPREAARWYQRAHALGSQAAAQRMQRLTRN